MKKVSRLEGNREVRRVLTRHHADMGLCQYSCSGYEVRLTGWLRRTDGSEYNIHQIEVIIQDFQRNLKGIYIQGNLDNWSFTNDHITNLSKSVGTVKGHSNSEDEEDDFGEVG
jgi:hypothetical protein